MRPLGKLERFVAEPGRTAAGALGQVQRRSDVADEYGLGGGDLGPAVAGLCPLQEPAVPAGPAQNDARCPSCKPVGLLPAFLLSVYASQAIEGESSFRMLGTLRPLSDR